MLNTMELLLFGGALLLIIIGAIMTIGYIVLLGHELFQGFMQKHFPKKYYYDDEEA